ncbi:DUF4007 family protein [Proteinivorax tanatarense]|uniref:DUF4007 family protein n=1 Tax=Proteinivorax tanatarense TaxID=1260629 RepID=A0AAU7VPH0_9FIRM
MKFRGHETFHIRQGWLFKGLKQIEKKEDIFLSKDPKPTDVLGMGNNMVKSLRYWLQAVGLTQEKQVKRKTVQKLTDLGEIIWDKDKYIEELGTYWILHYELVSNNQLAPTWNWFFNHFNIKEFNKEDFVNSLQSYVKFETETKVAKSSLDSDFSCLVNFYVPRRVMHPDKISPEDTLDCPFGQLDLVGLKDRKERVYIKKTPKVSNIPPKIALAILVKNLDGRKEVSINEILTSCNNLGKVFSLNINTLNALLDELKQLGYITINRTAGLDVVNLPNDYKYLTLIEQYYNDLNTGLRGEHA